MSVDLAISHFWFRFNTILLSLFKEYSIKRVMSRENPTFWFSTRSEANYLNKKNKALISRAVTSAYAKRKFSHDAAHSLILVIVHSNIETND